MNEHKTQELIVARFYSIQNDYTNLIWFLKIHSRFYNKIILCLIVHSEIYKGVLIRGIYFLSLTNKETVYSKTSFDQMFWKPSY